MEIHNVLQSFGLDEKSRAVYLSLLELGGASMTELSSHAKLKRPTAYIAVETLELMGLVSSTAIGKRKRYSAVHPRRFLDIARARESRAEAVLPELLALYNSPKEKPKIQVFEGENGVRLLYEEVYQSLTGRQEALWFTRIDALKKYMPPALEDYKKMLRRLDSPKIRELNYGNEAGIAWYHELEPFLKGNKNHEVRVLDPKIEYGHSDSVIYGQKMAVFSLRKNVFVTVIESEDLCKTFRAIYEAAWQMGTVPEAK